jgi:hypothetical protein
LSNLFDVAASWPTRSSAATALTLAIEMALRPLNAQLGDFNKKFRVRLGHPEA